MRQLLFLITYFIASFTIAQSATAQVDSGKRVKQYNLKTSVAIQGYDPVAYFTQNKAIAGSKNFSHTHQGVVYYFATKANLEAFKHNADKYEPQYGGWCAYAMGATGEKVEVDPETFKLLDGKLYLFYNRFFTNTLPKWNKEEMALKNKANANWQKFYH